MTEQQGGPFASPFDHASEPEEPPRGSVLAYQRLGHGGAMLDYVSLRAGDGRWYTTGKNPAQGVDWRDLWAAVRHQAAGPIRYATAWAELATPRPMIGAPPVGSAFTIDHSAVTASAVDAINALRYDGPLARAEYGDARPLGGRA